MGAHEIARRTEPLVPRGPKALGLFEVDPERKVFMTKSGTSNMCRGSVLEGNGIPCVLGPSLRQSLDLCETPLGLR